MLYDGFTPKLWVTLTEPNGVNVVSAMERVSKFLIELSFTTSSHLLVFRAGDYGHNFHEHIVICVPDSENERFDKRLESFVPWRHWRFRHLDFQKWDFSKGNGAFVYQDNHVTWKRGGGKVVAFKPYVLCPKCFRKCRQNNCEHNDQEIRRFVNHKAPLLP